MNDTYELVTDSDRFATLIERWHGSSIALDTEFVRTQTYFSRPGLVQLLVDNAITLLDPIALTDLSAFGPLLSEPKTTKILHAGAEDLNLLEQLTGHVPSPIFDCQIAAALAGRAASESYHRLVESLLGVELQKGETRSDWCQRPLRPAQLGYAADDVRYLVDVHHALSEELSHLGRTAWATEECGYLARPYPMPPYARARSTVKLSRQELAITARLWAWRERQAQARDLPRARVLSDGALIAIVQAAPAHRERLSRIEGMSPRLVRKSGDDILAAIDEGKSTPEDECPLPLAVPVTHRPLVETLRTHVRHCAEAYGLAPEVVASRRQIEAAVITAAFGCVDPTNPLINGWRSEVLGPDFRDALESNS